MRNRLIVRLTLKQFKTVSASLQCVLYVDISVVMSFLADLFATPRDDISVNGSQYFSLTALKGVLVNFLPVLQYSTVFVFSL